MDWKTTLAYQPLLTFTTIVTLNHSVGGITMTELNLNTENWALLDINMDNEPRTFDQDILATLQSISSTNIDDPRYDINDHQYVS